MSAHNFDSGFDRVSLHAVLVREGEDVGAALAEAGIHDPVTVHVTFDESNAPIGGIVPNLQAVLEEEEIDASDVFQSHDPSPDAGMSTKSISSNPDVPSSMRGTLFEPGKRPLAPIARRR